MGPSEAVLNYLQKQNRPYSANDIFLNLHKEIGKTQLQKTLDQLVEQQKIKEKLYGKQKIYVVIQDNSSKENIDKEIQELDQNIMALSGKVNSAEQDLKIKEDLVKQLNTMVSIEEAKDNIVNLECSITKLKEKLNILTDNKTPPISNDEREKILKDHGQLTKEWRKRKRICMDILNSILENYPKSKKDLLEEIGLETDEDVNVKMPN